MVSVIIDNHNYGRYIGEAIESVLNQTYLDFELIIVDGASTDDSRKVIMKYVKSYPQKITAVFKPTSGQAAAFNVGYKLSKGDIVALLDSDDYFYPQKLEKIVREHENHMFIGHNRIHSDGMKNYVPMDDPSKRQDLLKKYGFIYTYNLISSCISGRRELLDKIFPMPENEYITFADCYIKVLAQYYDNIHYLNDKLTLYRLHNTNKVKSFESESFIEQFVVDLYNRVFKDVNTRLRERGEEEIPILSSDTAREALKIANNGAQLNAGDKYAIYGAGSYSPRVMKAAALCGASIVFAIDGNKDKWGTKWRDLDVISLTEAIKRRKEYDRILIGATAYEEIENTLKEVGLKEEIDYFKLPIVPND